MDTFLQVAGVVSFVASLDNLGNLIERVTAMLDDNEFEYEKCRLEASKRTLRRVEAPPASAHELNASHVQCSAAVRKKLEQIDCEIGAGTRILRRPNINKHLDEIDKLLKILLELSPAAAAAPNTVDAAASVLDTEREKRKLLQALLNPKNRQPLRAKDLKRLGVYTDEVVGAASSQNERFAQWNGNSYFVDRVGFGATMKEKEKRLSRLGRLILNMKEWDNPCVAKLVMITEDRDHFCILSEVESSLRPLEDSLESIMAVESKMRILVGIAFAIESLHDQMIYHEGIGSHNVLVDNHETQKVKLTGFLSSRMFDELSDRGATSMEETQYLVERRQQIYQAPWRSAGSRYSFECDVYSFGVVMAEIHLGKSFVRDPSIKGREDILAALVQQNDACMVVALIRECMEQVASMIPPIGEILQRLERM